MTSNLKNISVSATFTQLVSESYRIGGSIPIVFSYYSEFLSQEKRGEHLSWLCMFWMIGGIYASAMAWAIIPHYGRHENKITAFILFNSICLKLNSLFSQRHMPPPQVQTCFEHASTVFNNSLLTTKTLLTPTRCESLTQTGRVCESAVICSIL